MYGPLYPRTMGGPGGFMPPQPVPPMLPMPPVPVPPSPVQAPDRRQQMRGRLMDFLDPSIALPAAGAMMMGRNINESMGGAFDAMGQGYGALQTKREEARQRNATTEWLKANRPDLAGMVEAGMPIAEAWKIAATQPKDERTDTMRNLEWRAAQAGLQPGTKEFAEFMRTGGSGPQVQVDARQMGNIPPGYQVQYDADGRPVAMAPIEGSPAWQEQRAAADQQAASAEGRATVGNIVLDDIRRARDLVTDAPWYSPGTGFGAGTLKDISGTTAADVAALTQTIRANIGFDRLQQMREESPTGGALGQVAVQELVALQSVLGNLEQSQSREQFLRNISRLEQLYADIMRKASAYPNATKYGFGGGQPPAGDGQRLRFNPATGELE